jgi:hypothetical protein
LTALLIDHERLSAEYLHITYMLGQIMKYLELRKGSKFNFACCLELSNPDVMDDADISRAWETVREIKISVRA